MKPWVSPQHCVHWAWWSAPGIAACGRWRLKDQKFKGHHSYILFKNYLRAGYYGSDLWSQQLGGRGRRTKFETEEDPVSDYRRLKELRASESVLPAVGEAQAKGRAEPLASHLILDLSDPVSLSEGEGRPVAPVGVGGKSTREQRENFLLASLIVLFW